MHSPQLTLNLDTLAISKYTTQLVVSSRMANLWRSKRLIYRACEEDDDAIFYSLVENDSEGYINSSMVLSSMLTVVQTRH